MKGKFWQLLVVLLLTAGLTLLPITHAQEGLAPRMFRLLFERMAEEQVGEVGEEGVMQRAAAVPKAPEVTHTSTHVCL